MAHLTIRNIGPIKEIDIELNRLNVFIGPQGSGKSTIAKIVSFCQWLEKDCAMNGTVKNVTEGYIEKHLIKYHNLESYFDDDSYFAYTSKAIELIYESGHPEVKILDPQSLDSQMGAKNAYIPSERNSLGIPGIFTTRMPNNYLLDFIDDWQIIRRHYQKGNEVKLLDLRESYYYNPYSDCDMLRVSPTKDIPLTQASSGLQSVAPLCVYINYFTRWIYNNEEDLSAADRERLRQIAQRFANSTHPLITKKSKLVIEEPELNLFPQTQVELVYYLLSSLNHERDSLIITTHSQYILYALNNCILATLTLPEEREAVEQHVTVPTAAWIDGKSVSVWELREGGILNDATIQDEQGLIRGNYFDRVMQNIMVDFHILMDYTD